MPALSAAKPHNLTRAETSRTELLLAQCNAKQLTGLADLLRFGIASSGNAHGSYVAAAWLLNVARHHLLPMHSAYQRADGSGFAHCDADWLEKHAAHFQAKANASPREALMAAMSSVAATPHLAKLETFTADALAARMAAHLRRREPSLLVIGDKGSERFALLLAINEENDVLFCCEIEEARARLKWFSAVELVKQAQQPGAVLECISLSRQHDTDTKKRQQPGLRDHVLYLDSDLGCQLLPGAEGLSVVAYAALHGQGANAISRVATWRHSLLSPCQKDSGPKWPRLRPRWWAQPNENVATFKPRCAPWRPTS